MDMTKYNIKNILNVLGDTNVDGEVLIKILGYRRCDDIIYVYFEVVRNETTFKPLYKALVLAFTKEELSQYFSAEYFDDGVYGKEFIMEYSIVDSESEDELEGYVYIPNYDNLELQFTPEFNC